MSAQLDSVLWCFPHLYYRKNYTTENAYRSHLNSKKHKENELRAAVKAAPAPEAPPVPAEPSDALEAGPSSKPLAPQASKDQSVDKIATQLRGASLRVDEDATEEEVNRTIDEKIAAARARLSPTHCLFCTSAPEPAESLEANLTHMSVAHSFFVPDAEFLIDLVGLVTYLGEKIAVGNTCVYCNAEFRTLDAVRKHMRDKAHCKLAYDTDVERLEFSDFYDFTASYPDADEHGTRMAARAARRVAKEKARAEAEANEGWEDVSDEGDDEDGEVDEIVEEEASDDSDSDDESDEDALPDNQVTYGDSGFELVLPSGARIGHRSMRRYYAQSFPGAPRGGKAEDPNSGAALVRRLLADKNSALVPRRGGFGAYGGGTDVVKARNAGEAREAGRHVREHRDQRRREEFKTKVGFIANSQKHFRAQIL